MFCGTSAKLHKIVTAVVSNKQPTKSQLANGLITFLNRRPVSVFTFGQTEVGGEVVTQNPSTRTGDAKLGWSLEKTDTERITKGQS